MNKSVGRHGTLLIASSVFCTGTVIFGGLSKRTCVGSINIIDHTVSTTVWFLILPNHLRGETVAGQSIWFGGFYMSGVISLTILLVIYAASEYVARRTNGIIDTVLTISVLGLIGFWSGVLPKNLFSNSGVEEFGMSIVGLMLTSLGTTINLSELKRQWCP